MSFSNPKHKTNKSIFRYYAGYSIEFVDDVIKKLNLGSDSIIMDPWNGSGTTTLVASVNGFSSIGVDVNPAMVVVAKAQCADIDEINLLKKNYNSNMISHADPDDPLKEWLDISTCSSVRTILKQFGVNSSNHRSFSNAEAFYMVAMFNVLKSRLTNYRTKNPTWVKIPKSNEIQHINYSELYDLYIAEVERMCNVLMFTRSKPLVIEASSTDLPIPMNSIDCVITSPPYCTRIDYAIMTRIELAILNKGNEYVKELRSKMIGSTKNYGSGSIDAKWGYLCLHTINQIYNHNSKAASTYYYQNIIQYFDLLYNSLTEIDRVLKSGGVVVMVLQNSYFKEVRIDLPGIVSQMMESKGFVKKSEFVEECKHNINNLNSNSKKYSINKSSEYVLIFKKK